MSFLSRSFIVLTLGILISFSSGNLVLNATEYRLDSLMQKLHKADPDEMPNLYIAIAREYLQDDPSKSLAYADTAINLSSLQAQSKEFIKALEIKARAYAELHIFDSAIILLNEAEIILGGSNDVKSLALIMNTLGTVYMVKGDFSQSINTHQRELEMQQELNDSSGIAMAMYSIAKTYYMWEKLDSALLHYNKALKIPEQYHRTEILGNIQNRLGNIFLSWGDYKKALAQYFISLQIYESIKDSIGMSKAYNNIGVIYHDWGNHEESLIYYMKSFEVDSLLGDVSGQGQTLNNIAILYDDVGNKEKAIATYMRSLRLAEDSRDYYQMAVSSSNIGGVYIEEGKYDLAENYLDNTVKYYVLANSTVGIAETDILYGDLYHEKGEYDKAIRYFNRGLAFALENKLTWSIINAYYGLSVTYESKEDYKSAIKYTNLYHHLSDSIFNQNTSRQLATQASAFEIQKIDQEMEIQKLRLSEQNMKISRQQNIVISLSVVIFLFFLYTLILIRQYRLRIRAWRQLLSQHNEILKRRQELILAKEKAEESDRLKSAFLVNLSHELRTPMNGIMGFTDLLQKGSTSKEQQKTYLDYIASSSSQLLKVLNDIIDISAIETNQLELSNEVCNIDHIMRDMHDFFQKEKVKLEKDGLNIIYDSPESEKDVEILSDRKRLAQIIFNLLSNALAFTNEGSITFGYRVLNNKIIRIFVADTGMGIERSKYEVIFSRFRQVDDTTTRVHNGSGLGLAISKELLNLMEGTIYLESEIGKGSTFYVEIPYTPVK